MDFFLEIIESDGTSISADDSGAVVAAALEEWGFLLTQIDDYDDLEALAEPAMEAFVEQLSSTDIAVQVAAGENIALLYEKAHSPAGEDSSEEEDEDDNGEHTDVSENDEPPSRFTVYRNRHVLLRQLESLASVSGHGISKRDKKSLHTNFSDILHSVENPGRGPRYSTATGFKPERRGGRGARGGGTFADEPAHVGSRYTVKIGGVAGGETARLTIDRWWKMLRFKALRRALQGGFVTHWQRNEVVFDTLPYVPFLSLAPVLLPPLSPGGSSTLTSAPTESSWSRMGEPAYLGVPRRAAQSRLMARLEWEEGMMVQSHGV